MALIEADGAVVGKDELLSRVWPGRIVAENNLYAQIKALRRAFADRDLIGTIVGRGYRFGYEVRVQGLGGDPLTDPGTARSALGQSGDPTKAQAQTSDLIGRAADVDNLAMADKPTLAVLPFRNMSGDAEQEYFADGVAEDIITALSKCGWFFVVSRGSSFIYKGRSVDLRVVGRELGVRYAVEGSIRRSGNRVRITGQLIDTITGNQVWGERYDGVLDDIFELQDRITEAIVGAIQPNVRAAEIKTARVRRPQDVRAYDLLLAALPAFWEFDARSTGRAIRDLGRALELDPQYALAHSLLSWFHTQNRIYHFLGDPEEEKRLALLHAQSGFRLDADDATVVAILATAEMLLTDNLLSAAEHINRALRIDPNASWAWNRSGFLKVYMNEPEAAISDFRTAIRLSPLDPFSVHSIQGIGAAHFVAGRYEEALAWNEKASAARPNMIWVNRLSVVCAAHGGQAGKAESALRRLLASNPDLTISAVMRVLPFRGDARERYAEGLRKAGLPE
jgi:adenylate cyclase